MALRLSGLPHDELAELAASACGTSMELLRVAEQSLAAHLAPLNAGLVQEVMRSGDILSCLMSAFDLEDYEVAAVCRAWQTAWAKRRRTLGLHRVQSFELPNEQLNLVNVFSVASVPGCEVLYIAGTDGGPDEIRMVDKAMRVSKAVRVSSERDSYGDLPMAASKDGLYIAVGEPPCLRRLSLDSMAVLAENADEACMRNVVSLAVGSAPLLYAAVVDPMGLEDSSTGGVVAFDGLTLEKRMQFGASVMTGARHVEVVGSELYVCDLSRSVHVFSLSGEHLRDLRGPWCRPWLLRHINSRLYLVEDAFSDAVEQRGAEDDTRARWMAGRRILVLSSDGRVLQVYSPPVERSAGATAVTDTSSKCTMAAVSSIFSDICEFDGELICVAATEETPSAPSTLMMSMLAGV